MSPPLQLLISAVSSNFSIEETFLFWKEFKIENNGYAFSMIGKLQEIFNTVVHNINMQQIQSEK